MFRSILVPLDLAHKSSWEFAIPQAKELAGRDGGSVTLMTVVRDTRPMFEGIYFPLQLEGMMAAAREKLASIAAEHGLERAGGEHEVRFGNIAGEILSLAREVDCELIVMESHRPEMRDYLIGPNAAHVARHATCSVLVLRRAGTVR